MKIGIDNKGQELQLGDICKFKMDKKDYEGMISYDSSYFCFTFEMRDDNFPEVFMKKADTASIEKIINVWSTKSNDEKYKFYQDLVK